MSTCSLCDIPEQQHEGFVVNKMLMLVAKTDDGWVTVLVLETSAMSDADSQTAVTGSLCSLSAQFHLLMNCPPQHERPGSRQGREGNHQTTFIRADFRFTSYNLCLNFVGLLSNSSGNTICSCIWAGVTHIPIGKTCTVSIAPPPWSLQDHHGIRGNFLFLMFWK